MAESSRNLKISSPGQIGRVAIGLDVRDGESVIDTGLNVTSNEPALIYGTNAEVSTASETINGAVYPPGHAIIFTLVCVANVPQRTRNETPYIVQISYRTDGLDPAEDDLTYAKEIDVYPLGIPIQ